MLLAAWNRHRKHAALTERALHPHTAAVQFDQFLNECESDPGAFVRSGVSALDAMKALKHSLAMLLRDSHSCVADLQLHCAIHRSQCDRNLASKRELERIGQKIQNHLFPHVAVHENRFGAWLAF